MKARIVIKMTNNFKAPRIITLNVKRFNDADKQIEHVNKRLAKMFGFMTYTDEINF